jgi:hypothetical protein
MKLKEIKGEKLPKGLVLESWPTLHIKKQDFLSFPKFNN